MGRYPKNYNRSLLDAQIWCFWTFWQKFLQRLQRRKILQKLPLFDLMFVGHRSSFVTPPPLAWPLLNQSLTSIYGVLLTKIEIVSTLPTPPTPNLHRESR